MVRVYSPFLVLQCSFAGAEVVLRPSVEASFGVFHYPDSTIVVTLVRHRHPPNKSSEFHVDVGGDDRKGKS